MLLHHSGFIVKDIDSWEKQLIFEEKVNDVIDPIQNSRLALYKNFGSSFIELIQPLNEQSFSWAMLQKHGNHFNHFCYSIDSMQEIEKYVINFKIIPVLDPVPAILFDNQKVAFFYTRNRQIVEFLIHD